MIVSHRKKFIFFCNPKTGTTSLEQTLQAWNDEEGFNSGARHLWYSKHMPPAVARALLPSHVWDTYFKFCFVRNPYDWLISQWCYHFRLHRLTPQMFLSQPYQFARHIKKNLVNQRELQNVYFDRNGVQRLVDALFHIRCFPTDKTLFQRSYAYSVDGELLVNHVGRFESLKCETDAISERLEIEIPLPHLNKSTRVRAADAFDADACELIAQIWAIDFQCFGYATEPPAASAVPEGEVCNTGRRSEG